MRIFLDGKQKIKMRQIKILNSDDYLEIIVRQKFRGMKVQKDKTIRKIIVGKSVNKIKFIKGKALLL